MNETNNDTDAAVAAQRSSANAALLLDHLAAAGRAILNAQVGVQLGDAEAVSRWLYQVDQNVGAVRHVLAAQKEEAA